MESFVEAAPPGALTPYIESMVGYRNDAAPPGVHVGMPSGTCTLVLALDEPLHLIGADGRRGRFDTLIAGLHASPAHILRDGFQHGVQLDLTPRATPARAAQRNTWLESPFRPRDRGPLRSS